METHRSFPRGIRLSVYPSLSLLYYFLADGVDLKRTSEPFIRIMKQLSLEHAEKHLMISKSFRGARVT